MCMGCTGAMGVELARFAWEGDWKKKRKKKPCRDRAELRTKDAFWKED